jgi:ribosomal protein S18 acetylase RimI-like enzyme
VVSVRPAGAADREELHRLYRDFFREVPPADYEHLTVEDELPEVDEIVATGLAFVAERDGRPVGFALARRRRGGEGRITDLYVEAEARRHGGAAELVRTAAAALREGGATHVTLWVDAENAEARAVYRRWGFREERLALVTEIAPLSARLARGRGGSFGSIHVQTDDVVAVERAVRQFVPRLPGGSEGSVVTPPRNGWIAVYDELCDREPRMLRRLARELSDRMGAVVLALGVEGEDVVHYDLLERGRVVDEYLSVPEYHGPRPPGEVVSLSSNPRLLARLTGGDPERIRSVARTASSSADLPPAPDLLAELAAALELPGGEHGYEGAEGIAGAVVIRPQ